MRRRALFALILIACAPASARAQLSGKNVELFGTVAGVGGATPVSIASVSHIGMHGGFRLDGAIQARRLAIGLGFRVWELAPTKSYGGAGLDGFLTGELRVGPGVSTMVRAALGAGGDQIDGGRGPTVEGVGTSGVVFSLGVAHEVHYSPSNSLLLSADLIVPTVNHDVSGRRAATLEIGVGFRVRRLFGIKAIPSRLQER